MSQGKIVVAGKTYRIARLELRKSMLLITARGNGPTPRLTGEPVTVYGADGRGVCQGWLIDIPATPAGTNITIVLPLQIASITSTSDTSWAAE